MERIKEVREYKGLFRGYCPDCGSVRVYLDYGFIPAARYCLECGWTEHRKADDTIPELEGVLK